MVICELFFQIMVFLCPLKSGLPVVVFLYRKAVIQIFEDVTHINMDPLRT